MCTFKREMKINYCSFKHEDYPGSTCDSADITPSNLKIPGW